MTPKRNGGELSSSNYLLRIFITHMANQNVGKKKRVVIIDPSHFTVMSGIVC